MVGVRFLFSALVAAVLVLSIAAQTTEFTYQGSLKDGINIANGNYDFEFLLFDALSGGAQVGSTLTRNSVAVSGGIFTVSLDFGSVFPGTSRFLEIRVRPTGQPGISILAPRQPIDSSPYSVKSLNTDDATNAAQLGGVAASQYVVTTDPRLTDSRSPTAGSANYVQNTTSPQASSNFNVSGTGTANIFSATTQYNIGSNRVLGIPGSFNTFAGVNAGGANTSGQSNSFFGRESGFSNVNGSQNSFFGRTAGFSNTGGSNSFFGMEAGRVNTTGGNNSFVGLGAGEFNTVGNFNTFFGVNSGATNTSGSNNTAVGGQADFGAANLVNATSIGFRALVTQSDSLVLGGINGVNNATADTKVGIGTTAPAKRLHIAGASDQELMIESTDVGGRKWSLQSSNGTSSGGRFEIVDRTAVANRFTILDTGNVGMGTNAPATKLHVSGSGTIRTRVNSDSNSGIALTINNNPGWSVTNNSGTFYIVSDASATNALAINNAGQISIFSLSGGGATALCRNASDQISTCSSSLRYKTNIAGFGAGMSFVRRLQPISFDWKDGGMRDVGFGAEDIEKIDPRFVTYNNKGEVEGVKYDRLSVAFVNAFNEQEQQIKKQQSSIRNQQSEIDGLKQQIKEQKAEIDAFKFLVCSQNPTAEVCLQKK